MNSVASPLMFSEQPWSPREALAPRCTKDKTGYRVISNGSEGCYGGWEIGFHVGGSGWVQVKVTATLKDLERGSDSIHGALIWDGETRPIAWEPLLCVNKTGETLQFTCLAQPAPGATRFKLRLLLAWSAKGSITWSLPEVSVVPAPPPRKMRLGAGGAPLPPGERSVFTNTEVYLSMCREAAENNVDLLCLPEVMLTTGLPTSAETLPNQAISIPGPEIEPFQQFCRETRMVLCFSAWEKNAELITNTALLLDGSGHIAGKYRKVHLASPLEPWWGVTPGHDFPVHDVDGTLIGMNICMDSSVAESARVPAMQGAEIICMPIMGDHRAVTEWDGTPVDFDMDRWCAIQRVRAMDNQVYMVVSRNSGIGTGIFAPTGDILALCGGRKRIVWADVDLNDHPRTWTWGTFKGVTQWVRRPTAYGPLMSNVMSAHPAMPPGKIPAETSAATQTGSKAGDSVMDHVAPWAQTGLATHQLRQ